MSAPARTHAKARTGEKEKGESVRHYFSAEYYFFLRTGGWPVFCFLFCFVLFKKYANTKAPLNPGLG